MLGIFKKAVPAEKPARGAWSSGPQLLVHQKKLQLQNPV